MVKINIHLMHEKLYPGNVVEGCVELNAEAPFDFSAVRVKLVGKEMIDILADAKTKTYEKEHTLIHKDIVTLSGAPLEVPDATAAKQTAAAGLYRYPFTFKLPLNLPASMSSKNGSDLAEIVYYVKAYVDLCGSRTASGHSFFGLLRPMPATQYANTGSVVLERAYHHTCCCCCKYGDSVIKYHLNRTVVALDRDILQVVMEVNHQTATKRLERVKLKLHRHMTYRSRGMVKTVTHTKVGKAVLKQPIEPGQTGVIFGHLPLGREIMPTFHGFNVWCRYELQVETCMALVSNPNEVFPITIVQSVDDNNSVPALDHFNNNYNNLFNAQVKSSGYNVPPNPILANNLIIGVTTGGAVTNDMNKHICGALGLPGAPWQGDIPLFALGKQQKLARFVWTGGMNQPQVSEKPLPELVFPKGVKAPGAQAPAQNVNGGAQPQPKAAAPAPAPTPAPAAQQQPAAKEQPQPVPQAQPQAQALQPTANDPFAEGSATRRTEPTDASEPAPAPAAAAPAASTPAPAENSVFDEGSSV